MKQIPEVLEVMARNARSQLVPPACLQQGLEVWREVESAMKRTLEVVGVMVEFGSLQPVFQESLASVERMELWLVV
jgi:hypothetical protein